MHNLYLFAALAALSSARAITEQAIACRSLYIPITASARNFDLSNSSSSTGYTHVGGDFTIYGRYCEPEKYVESRRDTLQVLVHGATYNINYWSGLAAPGTKSGQNLYSWVAYASKEGYPTLSIDRLCNGKSSRPNGTTYCQVPLEAQVMHKIIQSARSGKLPGVKTSFNRIIYVGHSAGSAVGNALTKMHPNDADAFLATGFSLNFINSGSKFKNPDFQPAQTADPKKWGYLDDSAYVIATYEKGTRLLFYYGAYKRSEAHYDFVHRGTATSGELSSLSAGQVHAPGFKGPVFVLNGNDDFPACTVDQGAKHGNCSDGISSAVGEAYPNARVFETYNTPNTGHCLNLHTTAPKSYKAAHDFLSKQGF